MAVILDADLIASVLSLMLTCVYICVLDVFLPPDGIAKINL